MPEDREPDPVDIAVLALLQARDGRLTYVVLDDGRRFRTFNIAWGYDIGDCFAHITTNISPAVAGEALDFFFTNEVAALLVNGHGNPRGGGQENCALAAMRTAR